MPVQAAICKRFKVDIFQGIHKPEHVYKLALFKKDSKLTDEVSSYKDQEGEVSDQGTGYATGGKDLGNVIISLIEGKGLFDFLDPVIWVESTIFAGKALLYNDSVPEKNAIAVFDFGEEVVSINDEFRIEFPLIGANTSLIRII